MKCDRKIPCTSCVKHKTGSDCDYSDFTESNGLLGGSLNGNYQSSDLNGGVGMFRTFAYNESVSANPKSESQTYPSSDNFQNSLPQHPPVTHTQSLPLTESSLPEPQYQHQLPPPQNQYWAPVPKDPNFLQPEIEALQNRLRLLESCFQGDQFRVTETAQFSKSNSTQLTHNGEQFSSHNKPFTPGYSSNSSNYDIHNLMDHRAGDDHNSNPTFVGVNPHNYNDPNELLDLYSDYSPIHKKGQRRHNFGPFAWISFMRKDRALLGLLAFFEKARKLKSQAIPEINELKGLTGSNDRGIIEEEFQKKASDRDGENEVAPINGSSSQPLLNMKTQLNKYALSLGLTVFEGEMDQHLHLLEKLKVVLPRGRTMKLLIRHFFTKVYPLVPLVDEVWFYSELDRLLGPKNYEIGRVSEIYLEKKLDFATLGILLVILRLSYLSCFSNNNSENQKVFQASDDSPLAERKAILVDPVNVDVINLAQLCLDQFDIFRRTSVVVLQLALIMRIYHMFAPEDGDGVDGGDSHMLTAVCVLSGYSMGLNREPVDTGDDYNDAKTNNLMRKLWFFTRMIDLNQGYNYGFPLAIDDEFSDIKCPFYRPGNSNSLDIRMEETLCQSLQGADANFIAVKAILKKILSLKLKVQMNEVCCMLSDFEIKLSKNLGKLTDYTRTPANVDEYPFVKILKIKYYVNFKSFLLSMFFHFFLDYEKQGKYDLAFFYLKKYLSIVCGEFVLEFLELIQNGSYLCDPNSTLTDMVLTPTLEFFIHKTNQLNFSILIRLKSAIHSMHSDSAHHQQLLATSATYNLQYRKLCMISDSLEKVIRFSITCLSKLSHRYYYAWRVFKTHSYIIDVLQSDQLYEYLCKEAKIHLTFIPLNISQLNDLLSILESSTAKLKIAVEKNRSAFEGAPETQTRDEGLSTGSDATQMNVPSTASSFDLNDFQPQVGGEIDNMWQFYSHIKSDMGAGVTQDINPTQQSQNFAVPAPMFGDTTNDMVPYMNMLVDGNVDNLEEMIPSITF